MAQSEILDLQLFGDQAEFDHIGVAVASIQEATQADPITVSDEHQRVSVAFVNVNGLNLELIEPLGDDSPIHSSLKEMKQLVHVCFRVRNLEDAISKGRENGFHQIADPVPAKAFLDRKIVWVFSRTYGLIELVERDDAADPKA